MAGEQQFNEALISTEKDCYNSLQSCQITMITETKPARSERKEKDFGPTASFSVLFDSEKAGWLHASLINQPEVPLFEGKFIEPFDSLRIAVMRLQNKVTATALLSIDSAYTESFGFSIGSEQVIKSMQKRYPECQLSEDRQHLVILKNEKLLGGISRTDEGHILVHMGGKMGSFELSDNTPVNDITIGVNQFTLLLQRFVGYTWQNLPELRNRQVSLVLDLPQASEDESKTYFSTFEIIGKEFRGHPREVDLETGIGGFQPVKDVIKSLVLDLTDPDKSRGFGTQPFSNRFISITGKEGTGKSLFSKALDTILRRVLKENDYFHLPINDIVQKYGAYAHFVVKTVLDHIEENEKAGIVTVLHLDNLEKLCQPDTQTAYIVYQTTALPIVGILRDFGQRLGPNSHNVLVLGESRVARADLPEGVQKIFRRSFELKPTAKDLSDALRVQIATTRQFAQKSGIDPFDPEVDGDLSHVIQNPSGLTGRDMQQALLTITDRNKASGSDPKDVKITPTDISNELVRIQISKGLEGSKIREIGLSRLAKKDPSK